MLEIFVERIFRKQPGSRNMGRDSRKNWKISMVPEFAQTPPEHLEIFDRRRTSFGPLNQIQNDHAFGFFDFSSSTGMNAT